MTKEDLNYLSLQETQNILYEMLKIFADFCDSQGLRYYLYGGTLLGAVRHQNFIPWDDDIDVCMPRPDYEKLRQISKKLPGEHYEIKQYSQPYIKMVDTRVGFFEHLLREEYHEESLFIDIFPVDGVPHQNANTHFIKIEIDRKKLIYSLVDPEKLKKKNSPIFFLKKLFLRAHIFRDSKKYSDRIEKRAKSNCYSACDQVSVYVWGWGAKDVSDKKKFENRVSIRFRDREFWCQGNYEEILRLKYDDYMQIPSVEERPAMHGRSWWRK